MILNIPHKEVKMKKKLCFLLLASLLITCVSALAIGASAADTTPTNAKGTYGLTFDASNPLTISGDVAVEPNTLSATVHLPKSYTARAGAVFGNYSGASGRTYTLEVNTNGQPRLFVQATNSTAVNLIFNELDVRGDEPRRVSIVMDKTEKSATCYVSDLSGNLIGKQTMTSTVAYPTFTVDKLYMIGGDYRSGNGQYFKGEVIEVAMYADKRTEAECLAGTVNTSDKDMIFGFDLTKSLPEYGRDLSGNSHHIVGTVTDDVKSGMSFTVDTPLTVSGGITVQPNTFSATIYLSAEDFETNGAFDKNIRPGVIISNYQSTNDSYAMEIQTYGRPRLYVRSNDHKYTVDCLFTTQIYQILKGTDSGASNYGTPMDAPLTISIVVDQASRTNGTSAKATLYVYDLQGNLLKTEVKETGKTSTATVLPAYPTDAEYTPTKVNYMIGGDYRSNNAQWFIGEIFEVAMYTGYRTREQCKTVVDTTDKSMICGYDLTKASPEYKIDLSGNGHRLYSADEPIEEDDPNWLRTNPNAPIDYAYSMAIVGDTQQLTRYDANNGTTYTSAIYDWLVANAKSKNMQLVLGLGDITNDDTEAEWLLAQKEIKKLDGVVPYVLNRGNPPHDRTGTFNTYFGTGTTYPSQVDGTMSTGAYENAYKLLTVGTTDYLILMLDWGPTDPVLQWAGNIISQYPNHRVIITTHAYLYADGQPYDENDSAVAHGPGVTNGRNNGDEMWDELVKLYPNIMMIICGHDPSDNIIVTQAEGVSGNTVTQMLVDPQGMDPNYNYQTGMVAMLYFSEEGTKVSVEYISTVRALQGKSAYFRTANQFEIDLFAEVVPPPEPDPDEFKTIYGDIPTSYPRDTYPFAIFVPDATSPTGYVFVKATQSLLTDDSLGVAATGSAFNQCRPDQNKKAVDGTVILMRRDFTYTHSADAYSNFTYNVSEFRLDLGGHVFYDAHTSDGAIFYWYMKSKPTTKTFVFTVENGEIVITKNPILAYNYNGDNGANDITTIFKNVTISFAEGATATSVIGPLYTKSSDPNLTAHNLRVTLLNCTVDYTNAPAGVDLLADGSIKTNTLTATGCTFKNRNNVLPKMNITMGSDFILNLFIPVVTADAKDTVNGIKIGNVVYSVDGAPIVNIDGADYRKVSMSLSPDTLGTILSLSVDVDHVYTYSDGSTANKTINSTFEIDIIDYLKLLTSDSDVKVANLGKSILAYVRAAYDYANGDAKVIETIDQIIGKDYTANNPATDMEAKEITVGMKSAQLELGETPAFIFYPAVDEEGQPIYSLDSYQFALDGQYKLNAEIREDENGRKYFYVSTYAYAMVGTVEYLVLGTDIHGYYNIKAYHNFALGYGDAKLTTLVESLWKYAESAKAYRESR